MRKLLFTLSLFLMTVLNSASAETSPVPKFVPKGIVFEGDSITAGVGQNTLSYPSQFGTLTGIPFTNVGLAGDKLILMRNSYSKEVAPLFNASTRNTLIINGGTNDIGGDSTSAARLESYVRDMATAAKATGYKVFVSTITPRGFGAADESIRVEFNSAMRRKWREFADGVIDFDAAVPYNGSNFYDGLHPTNQGAMLMAQKISTTLGLPSTPVPPKIRP